jgi:hypothetical protein
MRETRSSGSVEGVVGNHDFYSNLLLFFLIAFPLPWRPELYRLPDHPE